MAQVWWPRAKAKQGFSMLWRNRALLCQIWLSQG